MRILAELSSWNRSLKPQKVRPEDGGERGKTFKPNRPMRILAELRSWNRSLEPNLLLLHVDRSSYSSYSPQKVRTEDGGERQKTLNRPLEPESGTKPSGGQKQEALRLRLGTDKNILKAEEQPESQEQRRENRNFSNL